jgi:Mrp family chromosome partitioning ATPase
MATTIANDQRINVCVVELNWWWPGMINLLAGINLDPDSHKKKKNGAAPIALAQSPRVQSMGVAGILKRQVTPSEALIHTALPNLCLLPAGRLNVEQRPIAARSNDLPAILDELDNRFDLLILDVPPILVTSDAIALAVHGTATYLVVRHGATSIENVRSALDDIDHLPVGGVIMNHMRTHTPQALLRLVSQA